MTFGELSADSGVPIATLQYWARKLRDGDARDAVAPEESGFLEVSLPEIAEARIEVVVGDDVRVVVQPGFDPATLRAVVEALAC